MARQVSKEQFQMVVLTGCCVMFICWALHEFLERKLAMSPRIITSADLHRQATQQANPLKAYEVNKRLTKSLDVAGGYRIQSRCAIQFICFGYCLCLFLVGVIVFISDRQWFYDHFIALREDSVHYLPLLHISASLVGYYTWQVLADRYGKLKWSVLVHHWVTAAVALSILFGRYTPFATWYGFTVVATTFPLDFMIGFRAQYSFQYPEFTRKGFTLCWWWFLMALILNFSGQIFLVCNSLIYHYNDPISVKSIVLIFFCICCWFYDDRILLQTLRDYATMEYEKAFVLDPSTPIPVAPTSLEEKVPSALSVIYGVDGEQRKETQTTNSKQADMKMQDIPTAETLEKKDSVQSHRVCPV